LPIICVMVGIALSWGFQTYGAGLKARRLIEHVTMVLLVCISLFFVVVQYRYYSVPSKEQTREAVNELARQSQLQTSPKAAFCANNVKYLTYYSSRAKWRGQFDHRLCTLSDLSGLDLGRDEEPDGRWLIWAHLKPDPLLLAELKTRFSLSLEARYLKAELYRLKPRADR
jgi:hypothetical protein